MIQKLDEVDWKIIKALEKDARTPFTEIGREIGVSDATVHVRVKKMWETGIMKRYTLVVDGSVYERRVACYILMNVKRGKVEEVSKQLARIKEVGMIQEVHGTNDIIAKIWAKDLEGLRDIILTVQENPNITASEHLTVFKTWKAS